MWSEGAVSRPARATRSVVSACAVAAVVVALLAEFGSTSVSDVGAWVPDLLAGLVLIVCGLVLHHMGSPASAALALIFAGLTWFAGNLAMVGPTWSMELLGALAHAHRGLVLAGVVLLRPALRSTATALAGVLSSGLPVFVDSAVGTLMWAFGVLGLGLLCVLRWPAGVRARGVMPVMLLGGTVAAAAQLSLTQQAVALSGFATLAYALGMSLAAICTVVAAAEPPGRSVHVTDAVVHVVLGDDHDVRHMLASALRDPQLRLAFAVDDGWTDEQGTPTSEPTASPGRAVIPVLVDGLQVAAISCRPDVATSARTARAIASATGLLASNARLQRSLREEAERLDASRRRLLVVADEQRHALSSRLEASVAGPLEALRGSLDATLGGPDPEVEAARERCLLRVSELWADVRLMESGLGGSFVGTCGLEAALRTLTDRLQLDVDMRVDAAAVPAELAETVYLICSEAVANVLKHAGATRLEVVATAGRDGVDLGIRDDGHGGTDPSRGTGLRGLSDRVAALGGRFRVGDALEGGTEMRVHLPIGVRPHPPAIGGPV